MPSYGVTLPVTLGHYAREAILSTMDSMWNASGVRIASRSNIIDITTTTITQAHSIRDNTLNVDGISWALGSTGSRLAPLRIVPLTGKVIPRGFTLKEYKIKDTNENLCTF